MPKDHRIRLTDREMELIRACIAYRLAGAVALQSPEEPDLRAMWWRFQSPKLGGQRFEVRAARRRLRGEGCPESKS